MTLAVSHTADGVIQNVKQLEFCIWNFTPLSQSDYIYYIYIRAVNRIKNVIAINRMIVMS